MGEGPKLVWHRGKLAISVTENGHRVRRSLGTDDVAIAKARLAEFARVSAIQTKGGPLTVGAIYAEYIADREREGKSSTRIRDAWKRLSDTFSSLLPAQITKDMCRGYMKERRDIGVSNGTIHLELGYLRAAMGHAENEGWIQRGPYIPLPQKPPPRDHYIKKAEAPALLAGAEMPHIKLFIILALCTAGRAQAILELTWDRVDFKRRKIDLRVPGRAATPKGRATVPINETAYSALEIARKGALTRYVIEWSGSNVGSVKKGIAEAGRRAGLKVSPHVLRHSAAVWMAEDGVSMSEIAQYLGHTNPATTFKTYARYSPEHLQKAAKALDF